MSIQPDVLKTTEHPLMLSVSGMRGLVGRSLTPETVARFAAAFGSWLKEVAASERRTSNIAHRTSTIPTVPHVVLGRDSRPSGEMFEMAAAAGLAAVGCRVTRLGIATTPGVAVMVDHLQAQGGLIVTASHNPIAWNGVKPLIRRPASGEADAPAFTLAPPPDQAARIIERFRNGEIDYVEVEELQPIAFNDQTPRIHAERVLRHLDVEAIRRAKLKVVVDGVHGAGGAETLALLYALGVELTHFYAEPTGRFPHPPEPTREHLTQLGQEVRQRQADIGFAQDPDADRLAVVDERGTYIGEEYTLALSAKHVLEAGQCAVANLSTSRMLDDVAQRVGATVVRTAVGEANVADAMRAHGAAIGGEGNGGVIWPKVIHVRDSLAGMGLLLEMLATGGRPLSRWVDELPRYAIAKEKVPFDAALAAGLADRMQAHFTEQELDLQDGVRVDWPDRWVHVRPSNTEPILRLFAEAPDEAAAGELLANVRQAMK